MENFREIEQDQIIAHMLENEEIEKSLQKWAKEQSNEAFTSMMYAMIERDANDGGLILAIHNEGVEEGKGDIVFFQKDVHKELIITNVESESNKRYALVYTSKNCFKSCKNTSGIVMFIREVVELLVLSEQLDGVIINFGNEDILLDKRELGALLACIKMKESTNTGV